MSDVILKNIEDELKNIKKEVLFIKEHMVDFDTIMTLKEAKRFENSMYELSKKHTKSLSDVKKELGI